MSQAITIPNFQDTRDRYSKKAQKARPGLQQDPEKIRICLHECDHAEEEGCIHDGQMEPVKRRCALECWMDDHPHPSTRHKNQIPPGYVDVVGAAKLERVTRGTIHSRLKRKQYLGAYLDEEGRWFIPREEMWQNDKAGSDTGT